MTDERLKISSDLTHFYKYSFFAMVTVVFAVLAVASFINRNILMASVLILFVLISLVVYFVNPYRRLATVHADLERKTFLIEEKENITVELGINELERFSVSAGICKLQFKNREVVSFLLPLTFENPPKHTVILLLKEAIAGQRT